MVMPPSFGAIAAGNRSLTKADKGEYCQHQLLQKLSVEESDISRVLFCQGKP
jgi:hypothetical protein